MLKACSILQGDVIYLLQQRILEIAGSHHKLDDLLAVCCPVDIAFGTGLPDILV